MPPRRRRPWCAPRSSSRSPACPARCEHTPARRRAARWAAGAASLGELTAGQPAAAAWELRHGARTGMHVHVPAVRTWHALAALCRPPPPIAPNLRACAASRSSSACSRPRRSSSAACSTSTSTRCSRSARASACSVHVVAGGSSSSPWQHLACRPAQMPERTPYPNGVLDRRLVSLFAGGRTALSAPHRRAASAAPPPPSAPAPAPCFVAPA